MKTAALEEAAVFLLQGWQALPPANCEVRRQLGQIGRPGQR